MPQAVPRDLSAATPPRLKATKGSMSGGEGRRAFGEEEVFRVVLEKKKRSSGGVFWGVKGFSAKRLWNADF